MHRRRMSKHYKDLNKERQVKQLEEQKKQRMQQQEAERHERERSKRIEKRLKEMQRQSCNHGQHHIPEPNPVLKQRHSRRHRNSRSNSSYSNRSRSSSSSSGSGSISRGDKTMAGTTGTKEEVRRVYQNFLSHRQERGIGRGEGSGLVSPSAVGVDSPDRPPHKISEDHNPDDSPGRPP